MTDRAHRAMLARADEAHRLDRSNSNARADEAHRLDGSYSNAWADGALRIDRSYRNAGQTEHIRQTDHIVTLVGQTEH